METSQISTIQLKKTLKNLHWLLPIDFCPCSLQSVADTHNHKCLGPYPPWKLARL